MSDSLFLTFFNKLSKKNWKFLIVCIGAVRFVIPFFIFNAPIQATIASLLSDSLDGYVGYRLGWKWKTYHFWDKTLDYWWYIFIFLYSVNLKIFPVILILFAYRSIGQFLSLKKSNTKYLVWFPNILENYFIFYVLTLIFPKLDFLFGSDWVVTTFIVSLLLAITREHVLHVRKFSVLNYLFKLRFNWSDNQ